MAKVLFTFPLPPDFNQQIKANRGGISSGSRQKKSWTKKISVEARMQHPDCPKWDRVWVAAEFHIKNAARDSDGLEATKKFIYDGLEAAGILKNDNLSVIQSPLVQYFEVDRNLKKEQQFVNILIMHTRPPLPTFDDLFGVVGFDDDSEAEACA